jgi:WD40 repeat protein
VASGWEQGEICLQELGQPDAYDWFEAGHDKFIHSLAFTPDGRRLLSASADGTVKVWKLPEGRPVGQLVGHEAAVVAVAVSAEGQAAITGSKDGTVRVWDLANPAHIGRILARYETVLRDVAMMPDGRHVLCLAARRGLEVRELSSGKCLACFHGDAELISCAAGPAGTIAAGGSDGSLHLLRLEQKPSPRWLVTAWRRPRPWWRPW